MKKGVGDDPFAEVSTDQTAREDDERAVDESSEDGSENGSAAESETVVARVEADGRENDGNEDGGRENRGKENDGRANVGNEDDGETEDTAERIQDPAETTEETIEATGGADGRVETGDRRSESNGPAENGKSTTESGEDTTESESEDAATVRDETSNGATSSTVASVKELPYLARRQLKNGSVKADRDQVPFFLRADVQQGERTLRRAVEDELGQEINKTDLREAAYVFAQEHPEGVAAILREWGIEYLE